MIRRLHADDERAKIENSGVRAFNHPYLANIPIIQKAIEIKI